MELEVINPEHEVHGKMLQRKSQTQYLYSVTVQENKSVMLSSLAGSTLEFGFHMEKVNSTYQWVKTNITS
jgi:hypothetical protein